LIERPGCESGAIDPPAKKRAKFTCGTDAPASTGEPPIQSITRSPSRPVGCVAGKNGTTPAFKMHWRGRLVAGSVTARAKNNATNEIELIRLDMHILTLLGQELRTGFNAD
jgi:hypothetical protein